MPCSRCTTRSASLSSLKCAAEIFRTSLNPAFADVDLWSGELPRAQRRRSSALHFWFDVDLEIIRSDVIANSTALIDQGEAIWSHRRSEQNINRTQIADRSLSIDVEFA